MKVLLPWLLCFLLSGCGTVSWNPEQPKKEETIGIQILENNKEALTIIKNRTADDIELGYKTRSLEQKYESDEEFGKKVRAVVDKQVPESKKNLKKTTPLTVLTLPQCQDINTRLNVLILIILILNTVELTFLVIASFTRKDVICEKPNSKLARKSSDQASND